MFSRIHHCNMDVLSTTMSRKYTPTVSRYNPPSALQDFIVLYEITLFSCKEEVNSQDKALRHGLTPCNVTMLALSYVYNRITHKTVIAGTVRYG